MDSNYKMIVEDILNNENFNKLKDEKHHYNTTRFDHSLDVSQKAYKICKKLKLDYKSTARAALLHDFFFDKDFNKKSTRLISHYKVALLNSSNITNLSKKEKNIIACHMFPIGGEKPRSIEAVIVDVVDDIVSYKDLLTPYVNKMSWAMNFCLLMIVNLIRFK